MPKIENEVATAKEVSTKAKKKLTIEVYSDEYDVEVVLMEREMNQDDAKLLIGYQTEAEAGKEFGDGYQWKDKERNKVRLLKNSTNRPIGKGDLDNYSEQMLQDVWELNGETMTVDDKDNMLSAQHRILALVQANQLLAKDRALPKDVQRYASKHKSNDGVTIPAIIVKGVSAKKEVADTADTGRSRKLVDVVFRNKEFGSKLTNKELKGLAKNFTEATRLVWIRCGGGKISDAPKFHHREALKFQKNHPGIKECVTFITEENGGSSKDEGCKISKYVPLGMAAALMYLQVTSKTKEGGDISVTQKNKAEKFWTLLAGGQSSGKDLWAALRTKLQAVDGSGSKGRDEKCGIVVKAWEVFQAGNEDAECKPKDLSLKQRKNENGKTVLAETPRFGGLDVEIVIPEPVAESEAKAPEEAPVVEEAPVEKKPAKKRTSKKEAETVAAE